MGQLRAYSNDGYASDQQVRIARHCCVCAACGGVIAKGDPYETRYGEKEHADGCPNPVTCYHVRVTNPNGDVKMRRAASRESAERYVVLVAPAWPTFQYEVIPPAKA